MGAILSTTIITLLEDIYYIKIIHAYQEIELFDFYSIIM